MARLSATEPFIHPDCEITESRFGAYVEIGRGSRVAHSTFGDYSYCDRYADIANARIGDPDRRDAKIVAAWPVGPEDQVMLVTDKGQSIRCPASDVSMVSRAARGVRVLNVAPDETVVSVAVIAEEEQTEA